MLVVSSRGLVETDLKVVGMVATLSETHLKGVNLATETKGMFDLPDTNRAAEPRCSVRFEGDGTWSAFRGVVLLASGLPTVADAWDVIDRAAPIRLPAARRDARRDETAPGRSWRLRAG